MAYFLDHFAWCVFVFWDVQRQNLPIASHSIDAVVFLDNVSYRFKLGYDIVPFQVMR